MSSLKITRDKNPFLFYFMKADFFSDTITFNHNESKRINSYTGVCLTLTVIVTSIVLCLIFGRDIYQRIHPSVSQSDYFNEESHVEGKQLFFIFKFRFFGGVDFPNSLDYIDFRRRYLRFEDTVKTQVYEVDLDYYKCNQTFFDILNSQVLEHSSDNSINLIKGESYFENYFCVNIPELDVYNPYSSDNSILNRFSFKYCDINDPKRNCPSDVNEVLDKVFIDFKFLDNYVDSASFSDPIKYYINSFILQVSNSIAKRVFLKFTNNEFISDNGWLFETERSYTFASYAGKENEVNPIDTDRDFLSIILESPQIKTEYHRTYLKLQDIFAKIGGFVNGLIIVIRILSIDYFEFNYLITISQLLKKEKEDVESIKNNYLHNNKYNESRYDNSIRIGLYDQLIKSHKQNNKIEDKNIDKKNISDDFKEEKDIKNLDNLENFNKDKNKENEKRPNNSQLKYRANLLINSNTLDTFSQNNLPNASNQLMTNKEILRLKDKNKNRPNIIESEISHTPMLSSNNFINSNNNINALDNLNKNFSKEIKTKIRKNNFINSLGKIEEHSNINSTDVNKFKNFNKSRSVIERDLNNKNESYTASNKIFKSANKIKTLSNNNINIDLNRIQLFNCHSEELIQYNISGSLFTYIIYRLSYIFCCFSNLIKKRAVINNIKDKVFDFLSIQREIRYKL